MSKALLVLDFINDIVHGDGKIAASANYIKEKKVVEKANQAIAFARQNKYLIIFVKVGFSENYIECPKNSAVFRKIKENKALQLKTWGTDFHESLDIQPNDIVVIKHRISAFYSTTLEAILHANRIDTVILSGVSTNMVIESTAREAHDRDYRVIILENACAAATDEIHQQAIGLLSRLADIKKVDELESV